jgi:hypothetical protein
VAMMIKNSKELNGSIPVRIADKQIEQKMMFCYSDVR